MGFSFKLPHLPKYERNKDPQEHVTTFDLVMNLYRQIDAINAKVFVTTLTGKIQEWCTNLPTRSIDSYDQLLKKFSFHFTSKKKAKKSATYLFTIRQREDETFRNFMSRFNNDMLEVQDLQIDSYDDKYTNPWPEEGSICVDIRKIPTR